MADDKNTRFKIGITALEDIKQVPKLPEATVVTTIAEDGLSFTVALTFPLPDDDQVLVTERKKKDSDEISSTTKIIGLAKSVPLTFVHEGKTVGLIDEANNQIHLFIAKVGTKVGEAEDAGDSATE